MKDKRPVWRVILFIALLCGGAIGVVAYFRSRALATPAALLERMPSRNAVVLFIDFAALRRGGILQLLSGSKVAEEPDYREFVRKTGFDYTRDLESALVSFAPAGKYFLLKGRFDWANLRSYVSQQNGQCYNTLCRMSGSAPDRRISFFPIRSGLMALAVSPDDSAAMRLKYSEQEGSKIDVPNEPVWVSIPASMLKTTEQLPAGTRLFASSLKNAQDIILSLGADGNRFVARLDVRCQSEQDAAALAAQLQRATTLLRDTIAKENKTPNARDLSAVLTGGVFRHDRARVFGSWAIERVFLEDVLSGGVS